MIPTKKGKTPPCPVWNTTDYYLTTWWTIWKQVLLCKQFIGICSRVETNTWYKSDLPHQETH